MEELIKFILSSVGLTWIVTRSGIFRSIRELISKIHIKSIEKDVFFKHALWFLDEILNCSGCFGFWSGIFFFLYNNQSFERDILVYGCIGSISSLMALKLLEVIRKK